MVLVLLFLLAMPGNPIGTYLYVYRYCLYLAVRVALVLCWAAYMALRDWWCSVIRSLIVHSVR